MKPRGMTAQQQAGQTAQLLAAKVRFSRDCSRFSDLCYYFGSWLTRSRSGGDSSSYRWHARASYVRVCYTELDRQIPQVNGCETAITALPLCSLFHRLPKQSYARSADTYAMALLVCFPPLGHGTVICQVLRLLRCQLIHQAIQVPVYIFSFVTLPLTGSQSTLSSISLLY